MQIEIIACDFIQPNEETDYYLSQINGLIFKRQGNQISILHCVIDIISIHKLELYLEYLDWFNGKIRYKILLLNGAKVFIPIHHYAS